MTTIAGHRGVEWRSLAAAGGVTLLTVSAALLAAPAVAQSPDLIAKLKAGVACVEPDASNQLLLNADGAGAGLTDLLTALDDLSINAATCVQIRDAASALAQQLSHDNPGLPAEETTAVQDRLQEALREADQRAASVRFEIGPPPRNLTRNRGNPG